MDKREVIEIVRNYKTSIEGMFCNPKVYLFGSYTNGTATKDSDIDVAVVVDSIGDDWMEKTTFLWQKTMNVNTLIEPVLIDATKSSPLYAEILQHGIAI